MGKNPFKPDKNHLHHKLLSCFGNFKSLIIYNSMIIVPWLTIFVFYINVALLNFYSINYLLHNDW